MLCSCCASDDKGTTFSEAPLSTYEKMDTIGKELDAAVQSVQSKTASAISGHTREPRQPKGDDDKQSSRVSNNPDEPAPHSVHPSGFADTLSKQDWNQVDSAGYLMNGMQRTYVVKIHRNGEALGLELDVVDGATGMVTHLKAGIARKWNEENPEKKIAVGDRITEVNGRSGLALDLLDHLRHDNALTIIFQRASMRRVDLVKGGKPLGMDILYTASGATVAIKRLTAGVVEDWNRANARRELREGDRIFQVNGITDPPKLLAEIQNAEELLMLRYCFG